MRSNITSLLLIISELLCINFFLILFTSLLMHFELLNKIQDVYFYRGIISILISSLVVAFLLYLVTKKFRIKYAFSCLFCSCSLFIGFWGVIPVSLDRSISVLILSYMDHIDRPVTKEEISHLSVDVFFKKYKAIDRRVHEQLVSKNITVTESNKLQITEQGKNFISTSKTLCYIFNCDDKFLIIMKKNDSYLRP